MVPYVLTLLSMQIEKVAHRKVSLVSLPVCGTSCVSDRLSSKSKLMQRGIVFKPSPGDIA